MRKFNTKLFLILVLLAAALLLPACQKHEHTYGDWSTTLDATCVNDGVQTRTCSCGTEETMPISATGHTYGNWVTVTESTCVNNGTQVRTCDCGYEETKQLDTTEHSYGDWVTTIESTCVSEGTQSRVCNCGAEETMPISATGEHSYGEWITTTEATCVNEGIQTRACDCGAEETMSISATGKHLYGNWITTTAPTCTKEGVQARTCSCGTKESKSVSTTEHSYGDWSITIKATCRNAGEQARVCSCGHKETKPIRQLIHKWKAATCTTPKTCERCLATVGSVTDHTVGSNGRCTGCGANFIIDIKALVGRPGEGFQFYKHPDNKIQVYWTGENLSRKTITSYSVTIYFYNKYDEPAYSRLTDKPSVTLVYEGTILPGDNLIINNIVDNVPDCDCIKIGEIKLKYSDGTSVTGWYGYGWKIQY